jgi:hypothetical protein
MAANEYRPALAAENLHEGLAALRFTAFFLNRRNRSCRHLTTVLI